MQLPLQGALAGVAVYNEANEKIGDINDVILDRSGKVTNVILTVGGFLGVGEHYVAVTFDKLKWVDHGNGLDYLNNLHTSECSCNVRSRRHDANHLRCRNYYDGNHHNQ